MVLPCTCSVIDHRCQQNAVRKRRVTSCMRLSSNKCKIQLIRSGALVVLKAPRNKLNQLQTLHKCESTHFDWYLKAKHQIIPWIKTSTLLLSNPKGFSKLLYKLITYMKVSMERSKTYIYIFPCQWQTFIIYLFAKWISETSLSFAIPRLFSCSSVSYRK